MINKKDLDNIARARLEDAESLFQSERYDGAVYLCGYAIEVGLKSRICKTLKWGEFPETKKDFDKYQTFKTHNLDSLLHLSGVEKRIKRDFLAEWSVVASWDPEVRYRCIGNANHQETNEMILASTKLLDFFI